MCHQHERAGSPPPESQRSCTCKLCSSIAARTASSCQSPTSNRMDSKRFSQSLLKFTEVSAQRLTIFIHRLELMPTKAVLLGNAWLFRRINRSEERRVGKEGR